MARAKNGIIKLVSGTAYVESRKGKRIGVDTLNEALRLASQCCGVDCCEGVLRLPDQTTGDIIELSIDNDVVTFTNTNTQTTGTVNLS